MPWKKKHFIHTFRITLVSRKGFLCRISKGKYELVSLDLPSRNRKKVLTEGVAGPAEQASRFSGELLEILYHESEIQ